MRLNLDDGLVAVSALIAFSTSILVYVFPSCIRIFITPAPGDFGPTEIVSMGVPIYYLFMTTIGSVSALVGMAISKKGVITRILIGIGNLLILIHSAIGLLGYYDVIPHLIGLGKGNADWGVQTVYTPFIGITIFGLIISVVGLILGFGQDWKLSQTKSST